MKIPEQLSISDIIVYYVFGFLSIIFFILFYWSFSGQNWLDILINLQVIEVFLIIVIPYIVGLLFSGYMFRPLIKLAFGKDNQEKKKRDRILNILLGINEKRDVRVALLEDDLLDKQIKRKIRKFYHLNYDEVPDKTKREMFYIVSRFNENYISGHVEKLIRLQMITNVLAGVIFINLLIFFVSIVAILLDVSNVVDNFLDLYQLIAILLADIFCIRYLSRRFCHYLRLWFRNVWRVFLVVEI
jgi:hypothetical protein